MGSLQFVFVYEHQLEDLVKILHCTWCISTWMCSHVFLLVSTLKEILNHPPCSSIGFFGMCSHMFLQGTTLWKPCTTLLSVQKTPACVSICFLKLQHCDNPNPHFLQLNRFPLECVFIYFFKVNPCVYPGPHCMHIHGKTLVTDRKQSISLPKCC